MMQLAESAFLREQSSLETSAITAQVQQIHQQITKSHVFSIELGQGALSRSLRLGNRALIIKSHVLLGTIYIVRSKTPKTLHHLQKAKKLIEEIDGEYDDLITLGQMHSNYGAYYCHHSRHWDAIKHYEKALDIAIQANSPSGEKKSLLNLGFAYSEVGNWKRAIELLRKSIVHPYDAPRQTLAAYTYLADIFELQQQWDVAHSYRKQVVEQFPKNEPIYVSAFHRRLAHNQTHLKHFEDAWASLEKAKAQLVGLTDVDVAQAHIDIVTGYWHLAQADLDSADECYRQAVECLRADETPKIWHDARILQARILYDRGDYAACAEWLEQLDVSSLRLTAQRIVYKYLSDAYAGLGRWRSAFKALQKHQKSRSIEQADLHTLYQMQEESYRLEIERKTNQLLTQKNSELESLHQEKDDMLRIIAHDLKNPISALRISLQLLQNNRHNLSEGRVDERMDACIRSIDHLNDIVSQLTAVDELESNLLNIKTALHPVTPELEQAVFQYHDLANAKSQCIELHYGPIPIAAHIHLQCFEQIMGNLLSNAIKYSPYGSTIYVQARPDKNGQVRIDVRDEGPGLSDADKSNLFKKYARLSARPTGNESSTGLGLYIVKRLVEAMDGTVSAESAGQMQGTTFTIRLKYVL